MEHQQNRKKAIEDVISRKHFDYLGGLHCRTKRYLHLYLEDTQKSSKPVKYPSWKDSQSCRGPNAQKQPEHDVTQCVELGVVKHLGKLQEDVTTVVGQEHERTAPASRQRTLRFGSTILLKETSPICLKKREVFVTKREYDY